MGRLAPGKTLAGGNVEADARHMAGLSDNDGLYARIIAAQGDIVAVAHDPRQVIDLVLRRTQELTGSEGAVVELMDGEEMVYLAASGMAYRQVGLRLRAGTSLSGLCVRHNRVLRCDDAELDPRVDVQAKHLGGSRSMLVVPLRHDAKVFGVLKVFSSQTFAYDDTDSRTMQMMATLVGSILGHSLLHARLREQYDERVQVDTDAAMRKGEMRDKILAVIRRRRIDTVFQPIVRLADRKVLGLEALSRFPDAQMNPQQWFSAAAEAGLGLELELEAARTALDHLSVVPAEMRMSINISPETLVSPGFADLMAAHDLSRLVLEVTEHSTVADYRHICDRLKLLQRRGLLVAIDDAGAGFASMRHILRLVPDIIKLDISLTSGIDVDRRRQNLVAAILSFASGTGAWVIVEGVETEGELQALNDLGVEYAQGYLLGRPEPLSRFL